MSRCNYDDGPNAAATLVCFLTIVHRFVFFFFLPVSVSAFVLLCLSLSLSLYVCISLYKNLSLSLSFFLSVGPLSVSVCLSVCLSSSLILEYRYSIFYMDENLAELLTCRHYNICTDLIFLRMYVTHVNNRRADFLCCSDCSFNQGVPSNALRDTPSPAV